MGIIKRIKQFFCQHKDLSSIVVFDRKYDEYFDNDDLEDIPSMIRVIYCKNCGKYWIYGIEPYEEEKYKLSDSTELYLFKQITGINPDDLTILDDALKKMQGKTEDSDWDINFGGILKIKF